MDLTFPTDTGKVNYRVAALMLRENRILAMKDDRSPYFYLPGGRVHKGEAAEDAILHELPEELGGDRSFRIIRPVFLVQSFFTDDTDGVPYHELCLYFLIVFGKPTFRRDSLPVGRGIGFTRSVGWHPTASARSIFIRPSCRMNFPDCRIR